MVKKGEVLLSIVALLALTGLAACSAFSPQAGEPTSEPQNGEMVEGPVFVNSTEVQLMESFPIQVVVLVEGELPTPCHVLEYTVSEPDADGRIDVEMWSEAPEDEACIQVLEPFEERVRIGEFESGEYEIYLNGERIGQFQP